MVGRSLCAAALLLGVAWGGLPAGLASSHEPLVIDPSGDAFENKPEDAVYRAREACWSTWVGDYEECQAIPMPPGANAAGTPAPPGTDIVGLRASETPEHLTIDIEVARLDAGLTDATPRAMMTAAWWTCWNEYATCVQGVVTRGEERLETQAYLFRSDDDCSPIACLLPVELTFIAGTPGIVRFTIPRALLSNGDAGDELGPFLVESFTYDASYNAISWYASTPVRAREGALFAPSSVADAAEGTRTFTLTTSRNSTWETLSSTSVVDDDGDALVDGELDFDLLSLEIHDDETAVQISERVARVALDGPPVVHVILFAVAKGNVALADVRIQDGEVATRVLGCGDAECSYLLDVPVGVDVVEGTPGWINLTIDRADLGSPPQGARIASLYTWSAPQSVLVGPELPREPPVTATAQVADRYDVLLGPVYALRSEGAPALAAPASRVVIRDPGGDTTVSPDHPEIDATEGKYDLVLTTVEGTSPTTSRVTMGVRDLTRLSVPTGWKAIVYSAAVETPTGTFQVGFYRDAERGQFFCAADTLVLADDKSDPAATAWTLIDGVLSAARAVAGSDAGGGPSTITVFAPHSCFGVDAPGPIPATALASSIHLIPANPAPGVPVNEIWLADEARDENVTSFALGTALPSTAQGPWYAEPFGIQGFWDITGIALAVLLAFVGLLAVRRQRNALTRYMAEIDRALGLHEHDGKARDLALVAIRRRLRDDMVRGRISEAHFMVVESRLAEHLRQARIHELTEAFGELPHRLLQKLIEILADGTITREEARRFGALLEDSDLKEESKQRIQRKLALWVVDDAPN